MHDAMFTSVPPPPPIHQSLSDDHVILRRIWFNLDTRHPYGISKGNWNKERRRFLLGFSPNGLKDGEAQDEEARGASARHANNQKMAGIAPTHFPAPLQSAARLGNSSATGVLAQLNELAGNQAEALRWWKLAAKLGDLEGMIKYGLALYQGAEGES